VFTFVLLKTKIPMYTKPLFLTAFGWAVSASLFAQNMYTMQSINHHAPVQCSKSITINANAEKVWSVITDINHWAGWQNDISHATLHGSVTPGTAFDWRTGGASIHSVLHTVEPFRFFGWTGKTMGIQAIHNWTFTEAGGQTTVTVEESMQGLLAGLLKKSFNKSLEKGMVQWLNLLKAECEKF